MTQRLQQLGPNRRPLHRRLDRNRFPDPQVQHHIQDTGQQADRDQDAEYPLDRQIRHIEKQEWHLPP